MSETITSVQGDTVGEAFAAYWAALLSMMAEGQWEGYGELFTPDATYRRHGSPELRGRDAIRDWLVQQMRVFPGNRIVGISVDWVTCDEDQRHAIYQMRHTMSDPGDGSRHEVCITTMLTYGGHGRWSAGADVHSRFAYVAMCRNWARLAKAHGLLTSEDQRTLNLLGSVSP